MLLFGEQSTKRIENQSNATNSSVGKPTPASVPPRIRLNTFTQGQIIITHQVSPIIVIGMTVGKQTHDLTVTASDSKTT